MTDSKRGLTGCGEAVFSLGMKLGGTDVLLFHRLLTAWEMKNVELELAVLLWQTLDIQNTGNVPTERKWKSRLLITILSNRIDRTVIDQSNLHLNVAVGGPTVSRPNMVKKYNSSCKICAMCDIQHVRVSLVFDVQRTDYKSKLSIIDYNWLKTLGRYRTLSYFTQNV